MQKFFDSLLQFVPRTKDNYVILCLYTISKKGSFFMKPLPLINNQSISSRFLEIFSKIVFSSSVKYSTKKIVLKRMLYVIRFHGFYKRFLNKISDTLQEIFFFEFPGHFGSYLTFGMK